MLYIRCFINMIIYTSRYYLLIIKPNSRNLLIGEQPNPSKLLPPEDRLSRHRNISI